MKRILCSVSLVALAASPVLADASGDLWEVTSQMTMEGMPEGMGMPAQTRKVCAAHEWTKPPMAADERGCQTTDFVSTPTKASWKMKCPDMSGEGQIDRQSPDSYKGWIKIMAPQGTMTMNLTGRRVGDCDAGEAKREREAAVAQVQAQTAAGEKMAANALDSSCTGIAESANLQMLNIQMESGHCKDPKYRAVFCESLKKCDVYKMLAEKQKSEPEYGLTAAGKFCGVDLTAVPKACCEDAVKRDDLEYIVAQCPGQAHDYAAAKCAGLAYTALTADRWQKFCTTYAKDVMGKGAAAPPVKKKGG